MQPRQALWSSEEPQTKLNFGSKSHRLIKMFIFDVVCSCWGTKISLSLHNNESNSLCLSRYSLFSLSENRCCYKVFGNNNKEEKLQVISLW